MALPAEMFDQHMRAIGLITVRWASIDGLIYDILRKRLCLPEQAERFRSWSAGTGRLGFFRARLKECSRRTGEEKATLNEAISRLMQLWEDRNNIVHRQYGIMVGEDGGLSVCWSDIKLSKGGRPSESWWEPSPIMVDDLEAHAAAISEAAMPLRNFLYQRPNKGQ